LARKTGQGRAQNRAYESRRPDRRAVYGRSITTVGQVLGFGDELIRIVLEGAVLEIECFLARPERGGDDRILPVRPLWNPASDSDAGFELRCPGT
jgi:hypothetical protein